MGKKEITRRWEKEDGAERESRKGGGGGWENERFVDGMIEREGQYRTLHKRADGDIFSYFQFEDQECNSYCLLTIY